MAYNNPGTVTPKEEDSGLTVKIGVPKWLKTMWSTTAGRWFKNDNGYSMFFKILAGLILAPIAGGITIALQQAPTPFIFSQVLVIIGLLGIVAMATMDDNPTAKQTFWRWMTTTAVWYVAAVIGLAEIHVISAMVV